MGFFDKVRDKARGVLTSAKPDDGVEPVDEAELRRRLLGIAGTGVHATDEDGTVVVAWAAKVARAGVGGAGYENLYRAIRIELDADDHEASGVCLKTTTEAELSWTGSFTGSGSWERGQHVGTERLHVLAWLGPHHTEGAADERGYRFSWSDLRDPVIDVVTGAGWTYKPKRL